MSDQTRKHSSDSLSGGIARAGSASAPMAAPGNYPAGVPWVSMRGNRQNTGISPLVGFRFKPNGRTPILSSADTNQDGGLSLINATPIIGPGDIVYVGSSNSHFYSFSPRSQQPLAAVEVQNIVDSAGCFYSPALLYFPCGNFSLYESPADNVRGARFHTMTTDGDSPSDIHWFEGNVVTDVNNRLYAGNDDFCLYCCVPEENKYPLWIFPTGFFVWSACSFSTDNSTLYFASADMTLYALDLTKKGTPSEKWTFSVPNFCTSSPAVDSGNVVYFGAFDGGIYAVDGNTGSQIWAYQTGSLIYASPAVSGDGVLYIIASDGVLRALDTRDGGVLWEFFTGMSSFSSAALGPDPEKNAEYLIYVGTGNGAMLALDPTGQRRWSFDIATLYPQNSDPDDPAFWSSFRYPAINSSLAIGADGIATATSGGLILWIDYLYYTKAPLPKGINVSPVDDYIRQLKDGARLCYISPSGRMAETVLQPAASSLPLYPAEVISLTLLQKKTYGKGQTRSSFATLPPNLQITASDGAAIKWRESADQTQLYVYPIAAAATSRTITVSANGQNLAQFDVDYRSPTGPLSQSELLSQRFLVQQASFFSPFIVPALDQLGLATITIPFRVVGFIDVARGTLWAYGYESYNAGGAGAAIRNLLYVFTGTYRNGNLILDSTPTYFELTSFPTPLTTMKVTGIVGTGSNSEPQFTGLSLLAEYTETSSSLISWLCQLLTHWVDINIPGIGTICELLQDAEMRAAAIDRIAKQRETPDAAEQWVPEVWLRFLYFLARLALNFESILTDWKLFNSASQFTWAGTYNLGSDTQPPPTLPLTTSFHFDAKTEMLTATLEFAKPLPAKLDFVVGIVVLGSNGAPLDLNYTNLNQPPTTDGTTLTQAIDLAGITLTGCKAVVFVNLEQLPQRYTL